MTIKKGQLEQQKNQTKRLESALKEIKERETNVGENYDDYKTFVIDIITDLDSFHHNLSSKIIDITGNQKEEFSKDVIKRMKEIEVR